MGTQVAGLAVRREQALFTFTPLSRFEQAGALVHAIQRLSLARSVPEIQDVVSTSARRIAGADGAAIVLRDGLHAFHADEDAIAPILKGQRLPLDRCISGWAILNRRPAVVEDIDTDDRMRAETYRPTFVRSLVMVPVRTLDPVGAIGAYWAIRRTPRPDEIEMLQALADSTAVAIENVRLYSALEEARRETLQRLARAAEYRDDATSEHTDRVARTAVMLAAKLGRPEAEQLLYRLAAPLHDIGKLAVSDTLLLKPGSLSPDEIAQMKRHASAGAAILSGSKSDVLRLAGEIALSHHEWWDGSGYPSGLKGEDIPLSGRIVAIADVFDALAFARPYKRAWPVEQAVAEVERLSGRQFDPSVVEAFRLLDPSELTRPMTA